MLDQTQQFIVFLLSTETFNFLNIFYINSVNFEILPKSINIPTMIFNINSNNSDFEIFGLMSKNSQYKNYTNDTFIFQKLFFDSHLLTIFVVNPTNSIQVFTII